MTFEEAEDKIKEEVKGYGAYNDEICEFLFDSGYLYTIMEIVKDVIDD